MVDSETVGDEELLLHELAANLRSLPFEEDTRTMHLRALALKRVVASWERTEPDAEERRVVQGEIRWLVQESRRRRNGPGLSTARTRDDDERSATGS